MGNNELESVQAEVTAVTDALRAHDTDGAVFDEFNTRLEHALEALRLEVRSLRLGLISLRAGRT